MRTVEIDTPHGPARAHVHRAAEPRAALVLGHGAGGGVEARDLVTATEIALAEGLTVALVEQPYRVAGRRSPAPAAQLDAAWTAVIAKLRSRTLRGLPLVVGGRSSGARVACRTAAEVAAVRTRVVVFRTLLLAPIVLPFIVYAFGLYLVFDEVGFVGSSVWPIVAGQATLAFPLVFIAVSAGLSGIDPAVYRAGASLGARWTAIVALIELPLVRRHIAGGALFAFAFCFDEVVVATFVGSPENPTLPAAIFSAARETVSPELAAVSTVVTMVALTTIGALSFVLGRSAKTRISRRRAVENI